MSPASVTDGKRGSDADLLYSALRVLAVVLAIDISAVGIYGYAPPFLYFAILADYPPILAALVAACIGSRGSTRGLFGAALVAFAIVSTISFADFGVTRMHVAALRPLSSRPLWDLATFSTISGLYLVLLASTRLATTPLLKKIARLILYIDAIATLAFVLVKWVQPMPPLVPLFYGVLYGLPTILLFELTAPERRASLFHRADAEVPPEETPADPAPKRARRRRSAVSE